MAKKTTEWVSRILWLLGALFIVAASVTLMIAFSKTETMVSYGSDCIQFNGGWAQDGSRAYFTAFKSLPLNLYKASGYNAICAFACFVLAKVAHWFASKGE